MRGEILSVGTELLLGQLVDTNAPYLAQSLSEVGIDVFWISQIGDNQGRMVDVLRRGWERSDLIVISGGLGPTGDDLTREAIAELLGEEIVVQPELEADLRAFFARRGRPMPERNVKQATLIPSAKAIPNPIGTAPGWWVERDGRIITAMPGVPVEMKRMWTEEILPKLSKRAGGGVILSRTLKTLGIGESAVEEDLRELTPNANPTVATYAKQDGVHVRITAKAENAEVARRMVEEVEARARDILGDNVYGIDEDTVPDAIEKLLERTGLTLGTIESGTAGQLASALSSASAGASSVVGSLVAGSEDALRRLGIEDYAAERDGVPDESAVRAMAAAVRDRMGAGVGLAVACGMEGGLASAQHLGVVHCAVVDGVECSTVTNRYSTTLKDVRRRAVLDAMDLLRRRLISLQH